jgi:hypothetical protein
MILQHTSVDVLDRIDSISFISCHNLGWEEMELTLLN